MVFTNVPVAPDEIEVLLDQEEESLNSLLERINKVLRERYDGNNVEVTIPEGFRMWELQVLAKEFRKVGWGVKVDYPTTLTFWKDRRVKVTIPTETAPGVEARQEVVFTGRTESREEDPPGQPSDYVSPEAYGFVVLSGKTVNQVVDEIVDEMFSEPVRKSDHGLGDRGTPKSRSEEILLKHKEDTPPGYEFLSPEERANVEKGYRRNGKRHQPYCTLPDHHFGVCRKHPL